MDESGENKIYLSNSLFGNHKKPQITLSPVRLQKVKGITGLTLLFQALSIVYANIGVCVRSGQRYDRGRRI